MKKKSHSTPLQYLENELRVAIDELRAYENRLRERAKKNDEDAMRRYEVQAILSKDRIAELSRHIDYIKRKF